MSRPLKITELGLERQALKGRADSLTVRQVADSLNATLRRRGVADTISHSMVERYFAGLDKATVPVAHRPQAAVANAQLVVDVAQRTRDSLRRLDKLLPVAEAEVTAAGGKNWAAILGVLRESRERSRSPRSSSPWWTRCGKPARSSGHGSTSFSRSVKGSWQHG